MKWSSPGKVGWFTMIEIEINSRCNRRCEYCPNSVLDIDGIQEYMHPIVLARILNELTRIDYRGRISYHFYGEPLLHPAIKDIVARVTQLLPHVRQVLYTNGDFLDDKLHRDLQTNGIKRFIVTSHDSIEIPKRENQVVLFPEELNLTNRGGLITLVQEQNFQFPLKVPCFAASSMCIITVTGDILLCYEDAQRIEVMGDINDEDIEAIWFSPKFSKIRSDLSKGIRTGSRVCAVCSNVSHPDIETFDYRL